MTRGLGSGKTPEKLVKLLNEAVDKSSQTAVARETGIPLSKINRYVKGIGEPQQETLIRLADYFGVSVAYLRGETILNQFPDEADFYGEILASYEVLLISAIEQYDEIKDNDSFMQQAMKSAEKTMNFTQEMKAKFDQERLKKIQKLASDFLDLILKV